MTRGHTIMKRLITLFTAICICLSIAACGAAPAPAETASPAAETPVPTDEAQPLQEEITITGVDYSKADYLNRVLSGDELEALKEADLETLRAEISTIGDAVAFLDLFTPASFAGFGNEIHLDIDFLFDLHTRPEATFAQTYTAFAAWCLTDDYEDIKYIICIGENTGFCRVIPALAMPVSSGWWVYSPYERSKVLQPGSSESVEEIELSSLDNLQDHLVLELSVPVPYQIFVADADQRDLRFNLDESNLRATVSAGSAELVYTLDVEKLAALRRQTNLDNLRKLSLPTVLAASLSEAEISALVGKDAKTVAAELKTLGDVLYYMALSDFHSTDGDIKVWEGDLCWSMNDSPAVVFSSSAGNCGGLAAFVPYMLQGDCEEAGCLSMTCDVELGGGHVITYLKAGDYYYVFDTRAIVDTQYTWNGGISMGGSVETAGRKWRNNVDETYKLIFAYPTNDGDLPAMGDGKTVYLPEQYRDKISIVYEAKDEGYSFSWRSIGDEAMAQVESLRNVFTERPDKSVTIDRSGNYFTRVLSDEQLWRLKSSDANTLQAWISTVADAVAYLDLFESTMYDGINECFSAEVSWMLNLHRTEATAPDSYTFLTGWLLADDYPEADYLIASVQGADVDRCHHGLLLPEGKGFVTVNPAEYSRRENYVYGFEQSRFGSTEGIGSALEPLNLAHHDDSRLNICHLFSLPLGTKSMDFSYDGYFLIAPAGAKELHRMDGDTEHRINAETAAEWDARAKTISIDEYNMPGGLGRTTLDYKAAKALVGQSPEEIRDSVKTVGDVLQYMIAARYGYGAPEAFTPWYGDWGFDAPGDDQLRQNYGCCCGGVANTVSYLLQGDYEKVGTLRWIGGGNHTISWVYADGSYYVFDFTLFCAGGNYSDKNIGIPSLNKLSDYYDVLPDNYPKDEILIMVAFEAADAMYPSQWFGESGATKLVLPAEAEGKVELIYCNELSSLEFADVDADIPGWNR